MNAHHISVCLFSPLNPAHPPSVSIVNSPSPAYPLPVLHPLLPSVCLFALLNDCLSCFVSCFFCTTKPALYSSFCISFCLHAACVRLSVFAILHTPSLCQFAASPLVCTNRLLISYCCLLHHNACTFLLVTLHLHSKLTTYFLSTTMPFFCLYATSACILLFILLQLHIPSLRLSHLLLLFVLLIDCLSRSAVYCTTTPAYLFSLHSKLIAYFPAPQCMRISFCLHTLLHIPTMTAHHISVCLFSPLQIHLRILLLQLILKLLLIQLLLRIR